MILTKGKGKGQDKGKDMNRDKASKPSTGSRGSLFCEHCHRTNHTIDKCFSKQAGNPSHQEFITWKKSNKAKSSGLLVDIAPAFTSIGKLRAVISECHATFPSSVIPYLIDTGALHHITGNRSLLLHVKPLAIPQSFQLGGTVYFINAHKTGVLPFQLSDGSIITIDNVHYTKETGDNILPVSVLKSQGWDVDLKALSISKNGLTLNLVPDPSSGQPFLLVPSNNGLVSSDTASDTSANNANAAASEVTPLEQLHRNLGHLRCKTILQLIKDGHLQGNCDAFKHDPFTVYQCNSCLCQQSTKTTKDGTSVQGSAEGETLHVDRKGPVDNSAIGNRYYLGIVADVTSGAG